MLQILVLIPTASRAYEIELRERRGDVAGAVLPLVGSETEVDTQEFLSLSPDEAAVRYFAPAVAVLQAQLKDKGF